MTESRRYKFAWKPWGHWGHIEATDARTGDVLFPGNSKQVVERYEELAPHLADAFVEGYMAGTQQEEMNLCEWCGTAELGNGVSICGACEAEIELERGRR